MDPPPYRTSVIYKWNCTKIDSHSFGPTSSLCDTRQIPDTFTIEERYQAYIIWNQIQIFFEEWSADL